MSQQRLKVSLFLGLIAIVLTCLTAAKGTDLKAGSPDIKKQWEKSPHAGSMDNEKEKVRMNQPACAHCHTAKGYWEVILEGKKSTAPYKNPVGISCIACHHEDKAGAPIGAKLRAGSSALSCKCHGLLFQNDLEDFSHCPQGLLVKGKGGMEFEDKSYESGPHSEIPNNCAGCHMAPSPGGELKYRLGEHTFRVITKGEGKRRLNTNGCKKCHEDMSFQYVLDSQAKVKQLLDTLEALLPHKPKPSANRPNEKPRLPGDPSLNAVQAMASYNYYTVVRDGTYGVHNPVYIRQLLEHSIEALRRLKKKNSQIGSCPECHKNKKNGRELVAIEVDRNL